MTYLTQAQTALAEFSNEEFSPETVELVATSLEAAAEAEAQGNYTLATNLLEGASNFVAADLNEEELEAWVIICEGQL